MSNELNVVFRADASLQIGIGHVMRCLTLANALKAKGAQCHFICREHSGNLLEQIRLHGFKAYGLPAESEGIARNDLNYMELPSHASWLGTDWATDAKQTRVLLDDKVFDWLIVDHYALDAQWEQALRSSCRKIMVIDDLADRSHVCDVLLDQNLGRQADDYASLVPATCSILAGPRYALLRPEFAALREYSLTRRATPQLKRLLITMGGVDHSDATSQVLEALREESRLPPDCRIMVAMGPHAPWLERVRAIAVQMPWPTEVRVNVPDMAQVMADSDLVIGAVGGTSWERCSLGLPALMVVLAENQRSGAIALEQSGAAELLGSVDGIQQVLRLHPSFLPSAEKLEKMSQASRTITDGQGTIRVHNILAGIHG